MLTVGCWTRPVISLEGLLTKCYQAVKLKLRTRTRTWTASLGPGTWDQGPPMRNIYGQIEVINPPVSEPPATTLIKHKQ